MSTPMRIILLFTLFILAGCYTQFVTLETRVNSITSGNSEEALEDTLEMKTDTVIIRDREVCYWHRTFLGEWELRCYRTNYSDYWYRYYNRPWWYHQSFNYHHKYKKKYMNPGSKSNATIGQKTPPTNSAPTTKPKVTGPGKSGGRTKEGTVIVGKKPKQGTTAHIPKVPEKLTKQKQKAAVKSTRSFDNQTDTLLLDSIRISDTTAISDTIKTDSTNKTILLKPKPGKHRSKRKY